MYKKISDYGIIGDMHGAALVSKNGSIDYCSMPHMDSPTVFAALLDDEKGGFFAIQPKEEFTAEQEYIKNTNILRTIFKTKTGTAELTDFMPVSSQELFAEKDHIICRIIKVTSGTVDFILTFFPRPNYAQEIPQITRKGNIFTISLDTYEFTLFLDNHSYDIQEEKGGFNAFFSLSQNQESYSNFIYGSKNSFEIKHDVLNQTSRFWAEWLDIAVSNTRASWGESIDLVHRSLLALKLLTFQPTGAIAAAATTSLPEAIGAERNWDYRFTWIRDASFTLKALFALGHIAEADSFVHWLHNTYRKHGSKNLQIMYSLEGEAKLTEKTLDHLKGYKNSFPVRVGNGAYDQKQWDIYGEVMDTALRLSDYAGKIDEELWPFFRDVCNLAIKNWRKPDDGIWEVRNGPFHFVYSKAMCWVALDRGLTIAHRYGFDAPIALWEKERSEIKEDILQNGYNKKMNSFVQHYGSEELDSSLLLLGLMNFLPITDDRMQGTINACKKYLMKNDFLLRYASSDGLKGEEGGFILCNFWLIESLARSSRTSEAKNLLKTTLLSANHLGLISEEYDTKTNQALGNFPQAFSHIGLINSLSAIAATEQTKEKTKTHPSLMHRMKNLIPLKITLNKSQKTPGPASRDIAQKLKKSLNTLQGSFFDVHESRVNYTAMKDSTYFKEYIVLSQQLQTFDPTLLKTDNEKKAFWINIYNILIINGIIHFDIQKSVKEIFQFFNRIGYVIGGTFFSPDDIEHSILRNNRPHPATGIKRFASSDTRKQLSIEKLDPRIHFALVCASSSCPPIEFYDEAKIDHQLDLAGKSFINRGGLFLDKNKSIIQISQIFKWYASDFGKDQSEVLKYVLEYANEETRTYINKNKQNLTIQYQPYNWNLNKSLT